jgi:DNA transformation protein
MFEAAGCQRFTYQAKGEARSLGFYSAHVEAMESAREMAPWARLALQAAIAARQPKKATPRKKSKPMRVNEARGYSGQYR